MSKYTTEVRFICESYAGFDMSKGYGNVNAILEDSWNKVFDFDFPIFDPEYRSVLCQKILRHYYTREIGFETVGLWKLKLQTKMQEIMPYYNKLYETETFKFNPLYDIDYQKTHEGETEGSEDVNATHTGTVGDSGTHGGTVGNVYSKEGNVDDTHGKDGTVNDDSTRTYQDNTWDVFSDTPQGALTNVDNNTYLTNARKITKNGSESGSNDREYEEQSTDNRDYDESGSATTTYNETTGNNRTYNEANDSEKGFNTTMEYSEHVIGKSGGKSYASLIMEYRESLLNIDMMIIRELKELFMLVW